jgi:hypothetical protein
MQLTLLSAAAAMAVAVSASSEDKTAPQLNKECDLALPNARVINRCDYPVHIWSVWKNLGCDLSAMVTLKPGEIYSENLRWPKDGDQGVSIKISKTEQCKGNDITQLEYFMENRTIVAAPLRVNYLDVSYVDCLDGDCPTKKEGFYLQVGNSVARTARITSDNSWCPILSCSDAKSCAKMAYILPNDVQTKTCDHNSSMDFYMCGSHAPSDDDSKPAASAPAPASSKKAESPAPKPSPTKAASSADSYKVNAAAVTPAAEIKDAVKPKVKTNVVYVTEYKYVNAKRSEHAHAHARRHQPFHA